MTKLLTGKSVTRETAVQEKGRALVAVLNPRFLSIRLKGTRETYDLNYEVLLAFARGRERQKEHRAGARR